MAARLDDEARRLADLRANGIDAGPLLDAMGRTRRGHCLACGYLFPLVDGEHCSPCHARLVAGAR